MKHQKGECVNHLPNLDCTDKRVLKAEKKDTKMIVKNEKHYVRVLTFFLYVTVTHSRFNYYAGGDPDFGTWGGDSFDFHGGCDLVLVHNPGFANGLGMDVHVRTKVRQEYPFITNAAVRTVNDTLEVASFGEYVLNGISQADLGPNSLSEFSVWHTRNGDNVYEFNIPLGPDDENIFIKHSRIWFQSKSMSTVEILVVAKAIWVTMTVEKCWLVTTILLLMTQMLLVKSGKCWIATLTFPKCGLTPIPTKCILPDPAQQSRRRLGENVARE